MGSDAVKFILDNAKITSEWVNSAYFCNKNCSECNLCNTAVKKAVYKIDY